MKDEYGGTPIIEFISPNNYEKTTHKGHSSNFKSSEFRDVVHNKKIIKHPMKKVTSKNHKIYTQLYLVLMIKDILKMMVYIL